MYYSYGTTTLFTCVCTQVQHHRPYVYMFLSPGLVLYLNVVLIAIDLQH
jgi:hypothetical protein